MDNEHRSHRAAEQASQTPDLGIVGIDLGREGVERPRASQRFGSSVSGRRCPEREPGAPRARIHADRTAQIRAGFGNVSEAELGFDTLATSGDANADSTRLYLRRGELQVVTETTAGVEAYPRVDTDDATVYLEAAGSYLIEAAGGPSLAPDDLAPALTANANKKRTRVKLRGTVALGGDDTFEIRLRGKLKNAP